LLLLCCCCCVVAVNISDSAQFVIISQLCMLNN